MDTWQDIMNEAKNLIPPPHYSMFIIRFRNLHYPLRIGAWNDNAVRILQMIGEHESLSRRLCRYILSLGLKLSNELYFLTSACELLPYTNYLIVQELTRSFVREVNGESGKARIWVELLNLVWQNETLKHWLLQLARQVFPHAIERYEVMVELRSALDIKEVSVLLELGYYYRANIAHLDDDTKIEFLRSVAEKHFGNNYYLMNRFFVFVTGGDFFINHPRTNQPLQNPELFMRPGENLNFEQPPNLPQMPFPYPVNFVDPHIMTIPGGQVNGFHGDYS